MTTRLAASLALAAVVLAGATGCTFITPQSTTVEYSASDGVNVDGAGPVVVRNALIVANDAGTAGNLVAALVNTSATAQTVTIQVEGLAPQQLRLLPGELVSLGSTTLANPGYGSTARTPLPLPGFAGKPGTVARVFFQSGPELGVTASIPVLDGRLPHYAHLAP